MTHLDDWRWLHEDWAPTVRCIKGVLGMFARQDTVEYRDDDEVSTIVVVAIETKAAERVGPILETLFRETAPNPKPGEGRQRLYLRVENVQPDEFFHRLDLKGPWRVIE